MKTYFKGVALFLLTAVCLGVIAPMLISAKSGIAFMLGASVLIAYFSFIVYLVLKTTLKGSTDEKNV